MFTDEEIVKACRVKQLSYPLHTLEEYLNSRYLPLVDEQMQPDSTVVMRASIPKHIVLFWHNTLVPHDVCHSIKKIKTYNKDYQVSLYDFEKGKEFIKQYYGTDLSNLYEKRCIHPTMLSDFFRICYLYEKGGIYVDIDINCYNPLEKIFNFQDFDCYLFYSIGTPCCINNGFIVCKPYHELMLATLKVIQKNLTIKRNYTSVWECTGPQALSIALMEKLTKKIIKNEQKSSSLDDLKLASHSLAKRAYEHAELEYKKTAEGNWRMFQLPDWLYAT
ncbi:hypothetical protein COMNV_00503 [Commensalibacter sp. Nvir]|uniref:glycosyltransferase family 32 protein n=1 Tax=Commensalibacter sp. Nvir TaxID=3069817 RepID=UPI002D316B5D|nr:hypothetical protein COMNV_00503 [Commensalibacter sp. Nvir]